MRRACGRAQTASLACHVAVGARSVGQGVCFAPAPQASRTLTTARIHAKAKPCIPRPPCVHGSVQRLCPPYAGRRRAKPRQIRDIDSGRAARCAATGRAPARPCAPAKRRASAAEVLASADLGRLPLKQIVALATRRNHEAEKARRATLKRKARRRRRQLWCMAQAPRALCPGPGPDALVPDQVQAPALTPPI